eukprot:GHVN01018548.1.p1 GENE.GHVN01018548.1~~GHVN01018548.1.p1  ORF type:complete len:995 (+),score=197.89 GHVN01018548.1:336-2987(+)
MDPDKEIAASCFDLDKKEEDWKARRILFGVRLGKNLVTCSSAVVQEHTGMSDWRKCYKKCAGEAGVYHAAVDLEKQYCYCMGEDRGCNHKERPEIITIQNIVERKGAHFKDISECSTCRLGTYDWSDWAFDPEDAETSAKIVAKETDDVEMCGTVKMIRERGYVVQAPYPGDVCPERVNRKEQELDPCPIDCEYDPEWSDWSDCSETCYGGPGTSVKEKTREVTQEAEFGGRECDPAEIRTAQECSDLEPCARDCEFSEWAEFTECNVTCGGGVTSSGRNITVHPAFGGAECETLFIEGEDWTLPGSAETKIEVDCNTDPCPIDCELGGWDFWSLCSKTCYDDNDEKITQHRERIYLAHPAHGGAECEGDLTEQRDCDKAHMPPCTIDGRGVDSSPVCILASVDGYGEGAMRKMKDLEACQCPDQMIPCTQPEAEISVDVWSPELGNKICRDNPKARIPVIDWSHIYCGFSPEVFLNDTFITDPDERNTTYACETLWDLLLCMSTTSCHHTDWSDWSACDAPCGDDSHQFRARSVVGEATCPGVNMTEERKCDWLSDCDEPASLADGCVLKGVGSEMPYEGDRGACSCESDELIPCDTYLAHSNASSWWGELETHCDQQKDNIFADESNFYLSLASLQDGQWVGCRFDGQNVSGQLWGAFETDAVPREMCEKTNAKVLCRARDQDCETEWEEWSACSKTCVVEDATAPIQRSRKAKVITPAAGLGMPCMDTVEIEDCTDLGSCDGSGGGEGGGGGDEDDDERGKVEDSDDGAEFNYGLYYAMFPVGVVSAVLVFVVLLRCCIPLQECLGVYWGRARTSEGMEEPLLDGEPTPQMWADSPEYPSNPPPRREQDPPRQQPPRSARASGAPRSSRDGPTNLQSHRR